MQQKKDCTMIKSLKLTEAGIINLSAFPPSAVIAADEALILARRHKNITSPFLYLCKMAHAWCKERGVRVNWAATMRTYDEKGITSDTPRFEKETEIEPAPKAPSSNKAYDLAAHAQRLAVYNQEQETWKRMSRAQRKELLRPLVEEMASRNCLAWAERYCPYKDSKEIVQELVIEISNPPIQSNNGSVNEWKELALGMAQYTKEQRHDALTKHGYQDKIALVESIIAKMEPCDMIEEIL